MNTTLKMYVLVAVPALIMLSLFAAARCAGVFAPTAGNIQSTVITDRNGVPLREMLSPAETRHHWVGLDRISPHMIRATLAAEDKRFYRHAGADPLAIARTLATNIKAGHVVSGGSTITQQLARLMRPRPRTLSAKIGETVHAMWLELWLSKDTILEQYLNRAPYGNQLIGCEAAALMYFGKPARDLTIAEAAYLAIVPRAPGAINPYRRRRVIEREYRRLIGRMRDAGLIDAVEAEASLLQPITPLPRRWHFAAPHFVDMLPSGLAYAGAVRTSLDIGLQADVERIVKRALHDLDRNNAANAAAIVLDNATGEILALVGSGDYYDEAAAGRINGATARRQPGSTLKPLLYALALENGYTAASVIPDVPLSFPAPGGVYAPRNYDGAFAGPVRIRAALANSLNVPAVHLLSKLGVETFLALLGDMNIASLDREAGHYGLGLVLGNGEVTLMELAGAYAALARGGTYLAPSALPRDTPIKTRRIFSPATAYIIADILADNESRRMSFGEDTPLDLPFRVAAKTGTTKNFRDNWTVGFTRDHTVAVWVGNFDGQPMRGVSGISGAGPIFGDIMLALANAHEPAWFEPPAGMTSAAICPLSGAIPTASCSTAIEELFASGTAPHESCSYHTEVLVNTADGLIASPACGKEQTALLSVIDLPPLYHDWARAHGVPLPPHAQSPRCPDPSGIETASPHFVRITQPHDRSIYAIDPLIPTRLQVLTLKAESTGQLDWFVDGEALATTSHPHRTHWKMRAGRHRIAAVDHNGGERDEIELVVEAMK